MFGNGFGFVRIHSEGQPELWLFPVGKSHPSTPIDFLPPMQLLNLLPCGHHHPCPSYLLAASGSLSRVQDVSEEGCHQLVQVTMPLLDPQVLIPGLLPLDLTQASCWFFLSAEVEQSLEKVAIVVMVILILVARMKVVVVMVVMMQD